VIAGQKHTALPEPGHRRCGAGPPPSASPAPAPSGAPPHPPRRPIALAAPAKGGGLLLTGRDVALLRRLTGLETRTNKQGIPPEEIAQFRAQRLPKLAQLGVVERHA